MYLLLTILSVLAVLGLVGVLVFYVRGIIAVLDRVGGLGDSYLAKLGFGVRAIETHTSQLGPLVTQLNEGLSALADGFGAVERNLRDVAETLSGGVRDTGGSERGEAG